LTQPVRNVNLRLKSEADTIHYDTIPDPEPELEPAGEESFRLLFFHTDNL